MTATGLAQLFSRMNYLWGDPVDKDPVLADHWYKALQVVDDDAVLEALPILAQHVDRRPSIAQIIAQSKLVVASRPAPKQLSEPKGQTPYSQAWMTVMRAWREGRLDAKEFQAVADHHKRYFQSGNGAATASMTEEIVALQQRIQARKPEKETV